MDQDSNGSDGGSMKNNKDNKTPVFLSCAKDQRSLMTEHKANGGHRDDDDTLFMDKRGAPLHKKHSRGPPKSTQHH